MAAISVPRPEPGADRLHEYADSCIQLCSGGMVRVGILGAGATGGFLGARLAKSGADVILIAGKGHENYQEIAGKRLPFSDTATALRALAQRSSA